MLSRSGLAARNINRMMRDRCVLMKYVAGESNDYNYSQPTYIDQQEIPCSFVDESSDEDAPTLLDVPKADATFWLLPDSVLTPEYRIKLTKRNGTIVEVPFIYQVIGEPSRDVLLLKVKARMVPEKP